MLPIPQRPQFYRQYDPYDTCHQVVHTTEGLKQQITTGQHQSSRVVKANFRVKVKSSHARTVLPNEADLLSSLKCPSVEDSVSDRQSLEWCE